MEKKYTYIPRIAEALLKEGVQDFPVCLVTGPRQAGKSTLLRATLSNYTYATLDDLDTRALAKRDPKLFFQTFPPPVLIDEIQYAPDLLSYIKIMVDNNRHTMGQFVLTGSQTFHVMKGVTESLAGRIDIFDLYPLTWSELVNSSSGCNPYDYKSLIHVMHQGFYPELYSLEKRHISRWFRTYIKTYIERDVRDIKAIPDLSQFQTFTKLLAGRAGAPLKLSEIAKEVGIAGSTAKEWLSILESTYIVYLLKPYYKNHTKKLIKTPKLYFYDTGLLCHLLAIESETQLEKSPFVGAIFENMVIMEAVKNIEYQLSPQKCYYFKTKYDLEVDLVIADTSITKAFEIKYSMSPKMHMASGLKALKKDHPNASVFLLSLTNDFPGIPQMPDIQCTHWYNAFRDSSD